MKKKILLSPLIIVILIVLAGVGIAGASLLLGGSGDSNSQGINLQKGLVGWWKMDGNANDATSYQNDGTVTGATLVNDRKYQALKAYSFNGSTDNIVITDNASLQSASFSVAFWMKADQSRVEGIIAKNTGAASGIARWRFFDRSATTPRVEFDAVGTDISPERGNLNGAYSNITVGQWMHVAGTYNASTDTATLSINGVLGQTATTVGDMGGATAKNITIAPNETARFAGSIDDFRIYNRALSSAEISSLYESYNPSVQISDLQKGLVGQWKLDGNANDSTSYGNDLTNTNAVTFTTDRKAQSSKAGQFTSASFQYLSVADNESLSSGDIDFTVSGWVYADTLTDGDQIWGKGTANTVAGIEYRLIYDTSLNNRFRFGFGNGVTLGQVRADSFGTPTTGTWYFIVAWHDATANTINIQVNNGTVDSGSHTVGGQDTAGLFITGTNASLAGYWNGRIDDVRVYKRVLTAAEKTSLYESYDPGIQVSNLQKGLVGQWKMDGNANDATSYQNDGTVTGAVLANDRKGQAQKAYGFNGSSDKINAGNAASLQISNNITLAAWVNVTSNSGSYPSIVIKANSSFTGYGILLESGASYKPTGFFYNGLDWSTSRVLHTSALTVGTWYHLVYTYDHAVHRIYVNGVQTNSTNDTTGGVVETTRVLGIGYSSNGDTRFFNGLIDGVRVYNRALTATEVMQLYESY